jgi:hypothetical protein
MKKKLTTTDFIRRRAKGSPEEGETKDSALPEGLQKERKEQEEARRLLDNLIASGALPDASLGPLSFDLISKGKELEQSEGRVGLNVNGVMPFVDVSKEGDLAEYGVKYAGGDPSQVYELMLSQRAPLKTPEGEIRMPVVGQGTYSRPFAGGQLSAQGYYVPRQEGMPKSQYGGNVAYTRRFNEGGEVTNDDYIQQMMTGTPPSDTSTFNIGEKLTEYGITPADALALFKRTGAAASLALQPSEAKAMTMDEFLASRQAALDFEGAVPNEASATRAMLQAVRSRNPAQGAQAAQEMMRMYSGFGDPIKGRFDVAKADPKADMGRALYASTSPEVASQSAMDRLKSKLIQPTGMAVYPLDIPKQSILFMEETYPAELAMKLKKFANKTSVPKGPMVTGEELYQGIRTLPKEKQGEAVRLLGFRGAQFVPGGKPLSTDNFAVFDTDGTVSAITGKQFKEGGEVTQFIKAHA